MEAQAMKGWLANPRGVAEVWEPGLPWCNVKGTSFKPDLLFLVLYVLYYYGKECILTISPLAADNFSSKTTSGFS